MTCYTLAWDLAGRYSVGEDFDEVLSLAMLGLVKAARGFKPELGFRFTTYAHRAIVQTIRRGWNQRRIRAERLPAVSGNYPIGERLEVFGLLSADDAVDGAADVIELPGWLLDQLNDRELEVLRGRLDGRSLDQIGAQLGVTRQRASQLLQSVKRKAALSSRWVTRCVSGDPEAA